MSSPVSSFLVPRLVPSETDSLPIKCSMLCSQASVEIPLITTIRITSIPVEQKWARFCPFKMFVLDDKPPPTLDEWPEKWWHPENFIIYSFLLCSPFSLPLAVSISPMWCTRDLLPVLLHPCHILNNHHRHQWTGERLTGSFVRLPSSPLNSTPMWRTKNRSNLSSNTST